MKILLTVLAALTLALCPVSAAAQTTAPVDELLSQQQSEVGADRLPLLVDDDTRRLLQQLGIDSASPDALLSASPDALADVALALMRKSYPAPLTAFLSLAAVLLIGHILGAVNNSRSPAFNTAFDWFSAVAGGVILLTPLLPFLQTAVEQIRLTADFMTGFVPVFGAAVSASGQPASAALSSASLLLVSQAAVQFTVSVAVPLCGVFAALGAVAGICKSFELERLSAFAKSTVVWGLSAVTVLFVGFLSLQGSVAAAGDSLALRTVKMLVSGSVPVVGGGLSDAVGTVFTGMKTVKTAVGVYGIAAAVLYLLPALVQTAAWRLCVALSGFLATASGNDGIARLCRSLGDMLGVMLAVTALVGVGFLFSVVSVLGAGG